MNNVTMARHSTNFFYHKNPSARMLVFHCTHVIVLVKRCSFSHGVSVKKDNNVDKSKLIAALSQRRQTPRYKIRPSEGRRLLLRHMGRERHMVPYIYIWYHGTMVPLVHFFVYR